MGNLRELHRVPEEFVAMILTQEDGTEAEFWVHPSYVEITIKVYQKVGIAARIKDPQ